MSKPGKSLKALCKRLGVRLTVKRGKKRVYKSIKVLKEQCKRKKKKRKKVKRKFGTHLVVESDDDSSDSLFDQPYDVLHGESFYKKETPTLSQQIEKLKNRLLDKWEKSPKETIDRNFTAKKYPQKIPFMSNPNEEIEVTEDGRLFFKDGLYKVKGNIDIIMYDNGGFDFSNDKNIEENQRRTLQKLFDRKDIKPYPLDKFLQAFEESGGLNIVLAKYIYLLSKDNFPYDEYKYRTTMRNAKKLLCFYHPNIKFGRKRKRKVKKKVKRKRKVKKKVKRKRKVKKKVKRKRKVKKV